MQARSPIHLVIMFSMRNLAYRSGSGVLGSWTGKGEGAGEDKKRKDVGRRRAGRREEGGAEKQVGAVGRRREKGRGRREEGGRREEE